MRFEAINRATRYAITRLEGAVGINYYLLETGWSDSSGEWIALYQGDVSWSYLEEKLPALRGREGDKEGWVAVFAIAGIEVFN